MHIETPWLLLALGILSVLLATNALRPRRSALFLVPSFFAAWWITELPLHTLILELALGLYLVWAGAAQTSPGLLGLVLLAVSAATLLHIHKEGGRADRAIRSALSDVGLDLGPAPLRYPRSHLIIPPLMLWRRDVEVVRDVPYCAPDGIPLSLDIYRPRRGRSSKRPAIIQLHGGAWFVGFKQYQGIPLLMHMAASGWVGFNVDYRLSPRATFPDQLIDIKRAVAWIREHADELGVDPDFIVITGGSAGGHLAALMALTANDPEYQPDFEHADTALQAAVVFYGVFDIANSLGNKPASFVRLIERVLMKKRLVDDPAAFSRASPIERIHADAPPLFVIHGTLDNLASVGDARMFVQRLRATSEDLVLYAELPGAAHAFDVFPSVRTVAVIEVVERFLERLHRTHRKGARARRPR